MTGVSKRRVHSTEFKAKIVMQAIRSGKTFNEIGHHCGVHPVVASQWKKAIQDQAAT